MKNFSEIDIKEGTKERLIKQMTNLSGLSSERVKQLYENFALVHGDNLQKINESFTDFLNPNSTFFNFENFRMEIIGLAKRITEPGLTSDERSKINQEMYQVIEKNCGINVDSTTLLEIICYVLLLKNEKFEKVAKQIQFGFKTKDLFESENIDFTLVSFSPKKNSKDLNLENSKFDVQLYESLKILLSRNNKRWGNNYHLDNAYSTIVDYLNNEIKELVNMDNVVSVSDTFQLDLFKQMLTTEQLNPMYRHIDVLKNLIPDIQTLVFDSMLLINNYVTCNAYTMQFIKRSEYLGYLEASKILYAAISSSQNSSKIAFRDNTPVANTEKENPRTVETAMPTYMTGSVGSEHSQIFNNFKIDTSKLDLNAYPLTLKSAVDLVHIIKSCELEFNLNLRKVINLYVTKTFNLLASTEKVLLGQRMTNKFKNGY